MGHDQILSFRNYVSRLRYGQAVTFNPASRSRTSISSVITGLRVTTGWGNTCFMPSRRSRNSRPAGSGHTITSGRTWPWETSPPNRSWHLPP